MKDDFVRSTSDKECFICVLVVVYQYTGSSISIHRQLSYMYPHLSHTSYVFWSGCCLFSKYSTWRTRIPSLFAGLSTEQVSVEVRFTYVSFLNNDELYIFFYCFFHKTFKNDDKMIFIIS